MFLKGDRIWHVDWGFGTVKRILLIFNDMELIRVCFDSNSYPNGSHKYRDFYVRYEQPSIIRVDKK